MKPILSIKSFPAQVTPQPTVRKRTLTRARAHPQQFRGLFAAAAAYSRFVPLLFSAAIEFCVAF
jgi:hypothetical protein